MSKINKPSTLKHLIIAVAASTAAATGISVGVTYAVASQQDKLPKYTVTFKNWDGTILQQSTVKIGGNAKYSGKKPTRPTEDWIDYTFTGWDKPLTNILCDTEITATYEGVHQTYECIFYEDEECTKELSRSTINKGEKPKFEGEPPKKPDDQDHTYVFADWQWDAETWQYGTQIVYPRFNAAPKGMDIQNGEVKSYTGTSSTVVIPSEWEGKPITSIGSKAFTANANVSVTSVTIPNTITEIKSNAFQNATQLIEVKFADDINLQTLGEGAFGGCVKLPSINIPKSLTKLGNFCFENCKALTTIDLGNIVDLGSDSFKGCQSLAKATVATTNPRIHTIDGLDGLLFGSSPMGQILIKCMPGVSDLEQLKTVSDLWLITEGAFENCANITNVDLSGCSVTQIDDRAFANSSIKSFKCGDKLEAFTGRVFENCTKLESFTIGKSITEEGLTGETLLGCTALKEILVDEGSAIYYSLNGILYWKDETHSLIKCPPAMDPIKELDPQCTEFYDGAFQKCKALENYIVPTQIKTIGDYCFANCENLKTVEFKTSGDILPGEQIFQNCPNLTKITFSKQTTISTNAKAAALSGCTALKEIEVENGNPILESKDGVLYAKYNNNKWLMRYPSAKEDKEFEIPDDVVAVARLSFDGAKNLESISFPDNLKSFFDYAFNDCTNLKTIICKKGFTFNSSSAKTTIFTGCENLNNIVLNGINSNTNEFIAFVSTNLPVPETPITLDLELDEQTTISQYQFTVCKYIGKLVLWQGITSIGESAFQGCNNLESVAFPNTLITIGRNAFLKCNKLTSITTQTGLKTIDVAAFGECAALKTVDLSKSANLETISSYVFSQCSALESINLPGSLSQIGAGCFNNCISLRTVNFSGTLAKLNTACGGHYSLPFNNCSNVTINCTDQTVYVNK